jgi:hypothetical protein
MRFAIIIALVLIPVFGHSQEYQIELTDKSPTYQSIVEVNLGEIRWLDSSNSDHEAGFQYRLIVTRFEIYESLFIDKLILDIEGIVSKVAWTKKVDLSTLVRSIGVSSEQQTIGSTKWTQINSFDFTLGGIALNANIVNEQSLVVKQK